MSDVFEECRPIVLIVVEVIIEDDVLIDEARGMQLK